MSGLDGGKLAVIFHSSSHICASGGLRRRETTNTDFMPTYPNLCAIWGRFSSGIEIHAL